ncbi:MAG: hypothetical protein ACI9XK_003738, partial [Granulosicoccus sp.]
VKVRLLDQIGSSYNNSIICCAASWLRATEVSHVYISTRAEKKCWKHQIENKCGTKKTHRDCTEQAANHLTGICLYGIFNNTMLVLIGKYGSYH